MAESHQERDIRKNLKKFAEKSGRLATGTARLFLQSGKEMFERTMPTVVDTYRTNKDVLDATVRFLRNPADAVNRGISKATETDTFHELQKFAKYAIDDLKTGNLYDPNRDRAGVMDGMDDLLKDFGGFDMSGFDENGDWSEPELSTDLEGHAKIADIQEENASKRTAATIDAIGASTQAVTSTINANAQNNIRLSVKQHGQVMNALNNSLSVQTAQLKSVSDGISAQLSVAREAHNEIMGQMKNMTTVLTQIRDAVTIKKDTKEYKEQPSIFSSSGALDLKNYMKAVAKNASDRYGLSSVTGMLGIAGAPKDVIRMFSDNPWLLVTSAILDRIVPSSTKKQMERTNQNIQNFFPAVLDKLASLQYKKGKHGETSFFNEIASLFGVRQRSRTSIDTAIEDVNAQTVFTKRTATAIEVVIPTLLSQINANISGQPLMNYNYQSGKFERSTDVLAKYYRDSHNLVSGMNTAQRVMDLAGRANWRTAKEREDFQDYLYKFFQMRAASDDTFINPREAKESFMDKMPDAGSLNKKNLYYNLMMGLFGNLDRSELMQLSSDIFNSRASRDRRNFNINKELKENGLIGAFSGLIDEDVMNNIQSKAKYSKGMMLTREVDQIVDKQKQEQIKRGGLYASNVYLSEILSTLRRGIITFSFTAGDATSETGTRLMAEALSRANSTKAMDAAVLSYKKQLADEKERRYLEQLEKSREKAGLITDAGGTMISEDMDITDMNAMQIFADVRMRTESTKDSDNPFIQFINNQSKRLSGKTSEVMKKTGVAGIFDTVRKVTQNPFSFMETALQTVDAFMFKIIYGDDAMVQLEKGGTPSLMSTVTQSVKAQLTEAKAWFSENIGKPLRDMFFDKDKGLFSRLGKTLKENFVNPFLDPFKNSVKDRVTGARDKLFGVKGEDGVYSGGKLSKMMNRITGKDGAIELSVKNALNRLFYGDAADQKRKGVRVVTQMEIDGATGQVYAGAKQTEYSGVIGKLKGEFDRFSRFLFGDNFDADDATRAQNEDARKKFDLIKGELKGAAPSIAKGAGLGLLASFFLPGGPIIGTLLGSFGGLIKGSETFGKYLLGDFVDTQVTDTNGKPLFDKDGNPVMKKRRGGDEAGGLFSKQVADGLQRFIPGVSKGAIIGSILGGVGLLPFGLGSTAGMLFGSIAGMSATSDHIKQMIFGVPGDDKSGMITKEFREKVKKQITNAAGPALGGAVLGGAAWSAISSIGIIPGLSLLPGGPIFTMLGGITGAVNADKIKNFFFGEMTDSDETVEVPDPKNPGKTIKKTVHKHQRQGGMFGKIFDTVKEKAVEPLVKRVDEAGQKIGDWFKDSIVGPLSRSMEPGRKAIESAWSKAKDSLKNIGNTIVDGIQKAIGVSFNGEDGKGGLAKFVKDKILTPLDNLTKKIFGGIGKAIGTLISAPFKAMEILITGKINGMDPDEYFAQKKAEKSEKNEEKRKKREENRARRKRRRDARIAFARQARIERIKGRLGKLAERLGWKPKDPSQEAIPLGGAVQYSMYPDEAKMAAEGSVIPLGGDTDSYGMPGEDDSSIRKSIERHQRAVEAQQAKEKREKEKQEKDAAKAAEKEQRDAHRPGKKTNNEWLAKISKTLDKVFDEMKGQIGGVGWNTAYIKALLEKQFGQTLSDEELPEEMEGSKKNIKKRRTIFGKAKDAISGFFGRGKDVVGNFIGGVRDRIGAVLDPIFKVIDFFGNVKEGAKKLGSAAWKGTKTLGRGALKGIGLAGRFIGAIATEIMDMMRGIGSALGNGIKMVTGVLKDAALAASGIVSGLIQTAAEIAPDIASMVWSGIKKLGGGVVTLAKATGKKLWSGAKAAGRGVKYGVKWLFGKITGRDSDDTGEAEGGSSSKKSKKYGQTLLKLNGGYIDEVKDAIRINIGDKTNPRPYPIVNLFRGKILGKKPLTAIPVYIAGADTNAVVSTTQGRGGPTKTGPLHGDNTGINLSSLALSPGTGSTKAQVRQEKAKKDNIFKRVFKRVYKRTDRAAESANGENLANIYDRAIEGATSMEEVEAIKTAQQLNSGSKMLALGSGSSSSSGDSGGGILDFIGNLLGNRFGGGLGGILKKAVTGFSKWALPAISIGYGLTNLSSGEGHHITRGLEGLTQSVLSSTGLGKLSLGRVGQVLKDPTLLVDDVAEAGAKATTKRGGILGIVDRLTGGKYQTNAAEQATKLAKTGGAFTWLKSLTNPELADNMIDIGNMVGGAQGIKSKIAGYTSKAIGGAGRAIGNAASAVGDTAKKYATKVAQSSVGQAVGRAAGAVAEKGGNILAKAKNYIKDWAGKLIDQMCSNSVVKNLAGTLASKIKSAKTKLISMLAGEAAEQGIKTIGKETAESGLRQVLGVSTAFIATAIFAVADFLTGWNDAYMIFKVHSTQVNSSMRLTAAIYRTLSGAISAIPIPMIANIISIGLAFVEDPLVNFLYSLFASEEQKATLAENQKKVEANAKEVGMSASEYVNKYKENGQKRTWLDKTGDFFGSIGAGVLDLGKAIGGGIVNLGKSAWNGITGGLSAIGNFLFGGGPGWGTGRVTPMSQKSGKFNRFNQSMALTGCGPVAASMVGSAYGDKRSPMVANQMSYGMGMRASDGGTNPAFFSQYANSFGTGYGMNMGPVNDNMIMSNLGKGQPVVLMGRGGPFGGHMHYMVADEVSGKGNVSYVDPMTGARKKGRIGNLTRNSRNAIYSYGTGPTTTTGNDVTTAQNELVGKMKDLMNDPIPYSLSGPQDPDKGSASCASTVGWAYRKVLGISGMSASSSAQSKDSRFVDVIRLGQPGAQPGKDFDLNLLQPGDIVYMYNKFNSGGGSNHTEMYIGNGQDLSHGGPDPGPQLRTLDANRRKRVFAVRRYKPFTDGSDFKTYIDTSKSSSSTTNDENEDGTSIGQGIFAGSLGSQILDYLNNDIGGAVNNYSTRVSNIFNSILGLDEESTSGEDTGGSDSSSSGPVALSKVNSRKEIWKYLTTKAGFTPVGAAGLMGCWDRESGNRADRVEGDYLQQFKDLGGFNTVLASNQSLNNWTQRLFNIYKNGGHRINEKAYLGSDGNYYPGIGLAQWTGPRGYNLFKFAKDNGLDWRDLDTQLKFFETEAKSYGFPGIANNNKTAADAANAVLDKYEMSSPGFGERNPDELKPRQSAATQIYNEFVGQGSGWGTGTSIFGKKARKAIFQLHSYGTGSTDANVSALNDRVRRLNNLIANTRSEEDNNPANQMIEKISQAVSTSENDGKSVDLLSTIATLMGSMVELLKEIKTNTTPKDPNEISSGQGGSSNRYAKLPVAEANQNVTMAPDKSYKTGAMIIDQLTSK